MLADHLPHELAVEWFYAQPLLLAVVVVMAVVAMVGRSHTPLRIGVVIGAGVGLAAVLPATTWGACVDSRLMLVALAVLLASPALLAMGGRAFSRPLGDASFVIASGAVFALFVVGQSRGCWRDDSYIDDQANLYVMMIAVPLVASWLLVWGWSNPARARSIGARLTSVPRTTPAPLAAWYDAKVHAAAAAADARPAPSAAQVRRARALAQLAVVPMAIGLMLIPTVLLAAPGVVIAGSAWAVRRSSVSVRAGRSEWSGRSVIALVIAALLTVGGSLWLLIWAVQENFTFSSKWSSVGLWLALGWSVLFTVLIVRSLCDRRSNGSGSITPV